jgi:hypothetical protein
VNRPTGYVVRQCRPVILRITHDIQKPPKNGFAHGHGNRPAACMNRNATGKAYGGLECHRANCFLIEVAVDFENEGSWPFPLHDQGGIDGWQVGAGKDNVYNRPSDRMHDTLEGQAAIIHLCAGPDAGSFPARCRI